MATKARSPQYPAFGLAKAIELVRKAHAKIHTHKAPPLVVANAIGYTSLNGKSITALSTLKKYELVEEIGAELKVTRTALTILFEPANTPTWKEAMKRAALSPALFSKLCKEYPGSVPSDELVRSYLLQNGFLVTTVDIPIRAFRDTMALVKGFLEGYTGDSSGDKGADNEEEKDLDPLAATEKPQIEVGDFVQWESGGVLRMERPRRVRAMREGWAFVDDSASGIPMDELILERKGSGEESRAVSPTLPLIPDTQGAPSAPITHEKELLRGTISKAQGITYRLMVTGELGSREIGKLIKLLEAQKLVLEDDGDVADIV